MKINLADINREQFIFKEGEFCSIPAILVGPAHIGCKWTQQNKHLRSSIWSLDGELLSAGFKKFVNLGENPENFPVPQNLENTDLIDKIDGSCCIVDSYKFQVSMRTRGTFSYITQKNFADFELCLEKYPNIQRLARQHPIISWIYEIVTPNNQIILRYPEVDMILIGAITKTDYRLLSQQALDEIANTHNFKRPKRYNFTSLNSLCDYVKDAKGIEGCCLYSNNGQEIHKLKSQEYLFKHRLKDELRNPERVLDLWLNTGKLGFIEFVDYITNNFDCEIYESVKEEVIKITTAAIKVQNVLFLAKSFINVIREYPTRKEQALAITESYKHQNMCGIMFNLLDNKEITDNMYKQLMQQNMEC
jgi:RNA ligase